MSMMTEREEEDCRCLSFNDPSLTRVDICLRDADDKARQYGQALLYNDVVKSLQIFQMSTSYVGDFDDLIEFVATSESLEIFQLDSVNNVSVVERFMVALVKSKSIKEITLNILTIPSDCLSSLFLCTDAPLSEIKIRQCELGNMALGADFVAANCESRPIEELILVQNDDELSLQVLHDISLCSESHIEKLCIANEDTAGISVVFSAKIKTVLETSKKLQEIEFQGTHFQDISFSPISAGCILSQSLEGLILERCVFLDLQSTRLFQNIFQNSQIQSLNISNNIQFYDVKDFTTILSDVIRSSNSDRSGACHEGSLRNIKFTYLGNSFWSDHSMKLILRTLSQANSSVESLHLGNITSTSNIEMLSIEISDLWNLKRLGFYLPFCNKDNVNLLSQSMKENYCLEQIEGCSEFLRLARTNTYFYRNKQIHEWLDAPDNVNESLWPHILEKSLIYKHHHEVIFKMLTTFHE